MICNVLSFPVIHEYVKEDANEAASADIWSKYPIFLQKYLALMFALGVGVGEIEFV